MKIPLPTLLIIIATHTFSLRTLLQARLVVVEDPSLQVKMVYDMLMLLSGRILVRRKYS